MHSLPNTTQRNAAAGDPAAAFCFCRTKNFVRPPSRRPFASSLAFHSAARCAAPPYAWHHVSVRPRSDMRSDGRTAGAKLFLFIRPLQPGRNMFHVSHTHTNTQTFTRGTIIRLQPLQRHVIVLVECSQSSVVVCSMCNEIRCHHRYIKHPAIVVLCTQ